MLVSMFEALGTVPRGTHEEKIMEKKGDVREEQREKADEEKGEGGHQYMTGKEINKKKTMRHTLVKASFSHFK